MLRLIIQTKRKYNKKTKQNKEEEETNSDEELMNKNHEEECKDSHQNCEEETEEGNSSNADCEQDSEVSFMNDTRRRNRHSRYWTRGLDRIHKKKHNRSRRKDEVSQDPLLDWHTKKDEMETSDENCIAPRDKVDNESRKMDPALSVGTKEAYRAVGRLKKRCEDDVNQFFKLWSNWSVDTDSKRSKRWKDMEIEFAAASKAGLEQGLHDRTGRLLEVDSVRLTLSGEPHEDGNCRLCGLTWTTTTRTRIAVFVVGREQPLRGRELRVWWAQIKKIGRARHTFPWFFSLTSQWDPRIPQSSWPVRSCRPSRRDQEDTPLNSVEFVTAQACFSFLCDCHSSKA